MTRLAVFSLVLFAACGPDTAAWHGTYTGSGSYTAGRPPVVVTGTVQVSPAGQFTVSGKGDGPSFTGTLQAETVTDTTATFTLPATGTVAATPADGCTRALTVTSASATRTGDQLELVISGTAKIDCAGGSSVSESFRLELYGDRG
jgi:hypothetical protein